MASGTLADTNITWDFNESTGVLTLGGTGELPSGNTTNVIPWDKNNVTKLIVKNGVTAIGNSWFNLTLGLKEIVFSDSVARIGTNNWMASFGAFYGCTSLEKITFGSGLNTISTHAFNACTAVKEIYFKGGQPTFSYASFLSKNYYCQFSLGTINTPVTATVYSNGWASDSVFTGGAADTTIRGKYTTFNYVVWVPPSGVEIPVNVGGSWKQSTPYVNVNGAWKEVTNAYVNVNGTWKEVV